MHLKDVDTYALSKAEGRDKMGTFRALGHGTVNFPAVKAALEEVGLRRRPLRGAGPPRGVQFPFC